MLSAIDNLRATLTWAAGARRPLPDLATVDEEEFFSALRGHRLEGRMLYRLNHENLAVPQGWAHRLSSEVRRTASRVTTQIWLYERIRERLRERDGSQELIPIKGFDLYAHTGLSQHMSRSNDIDVIGEDPEAVISAATEVQDILTQRKQHAHEYAVLTTRPDGLDIDLHYRFNITGFPADRPVGAYTPSTSPGRWELKDSFNISSLSYDDLKTHLVLRPLGSAALPVLTPAMAAFVRCAHIYLGYLEHPFPRPQATIRLGELSILFDLVSQCTFDPREFAYLCHAHNGHLVVRFARQLGIDLLGQDPFHAHPALGILSERNHHWFPHNLWWDGIAEGLPVHLGWSPADLVVRSPDLAYTTNDLAPVHVPIGVGRGVRLSMLGGDTDELARFIFRKRHGEPFEVVLNLAATSTSLEVSASFPAGSGDPISAIAVCSYDWKYELFFMSHDQSFELTDYSIDLHPGSPPHADCYSDGTRHFMKMLLPWQALGRKGPPSKTEEIPLLLKAKQHEQNWGPVRGITIAPLTLQATATESSRP